MLSPISVPNASLHLAILNMMLSRGFPNENLRVLVVRFQVVFDGSKQFRNTAKTAAANPLVGNLSKPTLDQFPPRTRCRVEVNVESELWVASYSAKKCLIAKPDS